MASSIFTTKDGTEIFYKDWGTGQPIVFHHGWPLSADDWDSQMLFFLAHGYRVIAHDRRGHGRSTQTDLGNDMDTYAADSAALVELLNLKGAIHVGHSTGGGEVIRYVAQYGGDGRVAKAAIISAIPPVMVKSASNPGGTPIEVFDGFRAGMANRAQFYRDVPEGPFYGFNRPGAKVSQGIIDNWWRQGMMGGTKAHYDCIKVFSETDHTEDLKKITVPVLVMHSEDDQIVPFADAGPLAAKLLRNGTLKVYKDFPHGMLAHFGQRQRFGEFPVEPCNDRRRRAAGGEEANPRIDLQRRQSGFGRGGYVGGERRTRGRGHGERFHRACAHLRQQRRHGSNRKVHPAGDDVRNRFGDAAVGHKSEIEVGVLRQHFSAEMVRRPDRRDRDAD
jgi:non-heme chloroperoxidase